jgi:hypothetical protein
MRMDLKSGTDFKVEVLALLIAATLFSGCGGITPRAKSAIKELRIGMRDEEAIVLMRTAGADWGRIYWGGTGSSRIYFGVGKEQQVWVEVSGAPDFAVTQIGQLEPKREWTRHGGDSITVR